MQLRIHGNGKDGNFKGKVIGFSNRLNTILVPQSFMDWSNKQYSAEDVEAPTRLIVEVGNPADDQVTQYIDRKGYEVDADKLNAEKTMFFLKMIVSMVLVVGLVISALSFYILMLSIYLLVQKNADKMKNLLLIGYSPSNVALPYQLLTVGLNISVLIIAMVILFFIRGYYMDVILNLFPELDSSSIMPTLLLGLGLFAIVSLINVLAIRKKIMSVW
jgi:cell division protein FtsX